MPEKKSGTAWIGTSNIVVPGPKKDFPPDFRDKSRLNYYSSIFNSLEQNSTFYKVPMPGTFEKWSLDVSDNFNFSIKLWRDITHGKELKFNTDDIQKFVQASEQLGAKKGCLLIQFPGKINLQYYNKVEEILQELSNLESSSHWRVAIEFRNQSWHAGETIELLNEYGATMVLHDHPKARNFQVLTKADFIYLRFHGPEGDYRGSYSESFLKEISVTIQDCLKQGADVYAYFNNTMGTAFENAITLQKMTANK